MNRVGVRVQDLFDEKILLQKVEGALDTKNQILRSHRPVSFVLPNGTVKASALTLRSAAHTLTFRGKVRVHIVKPPKQDKPAKEEAPPAQVVVPPMPEASGAVPADTSALTAETP
mgnify:CR=1 FL=1